MFTVGEDEPGEGADTEVLQSFFRGFLGLNGLDGKIVALDTPQNLTNKYKSKNMDEVFVKLARIPVTNSE